MRSRKRGILIGTGGFGGWWLRSFLPRFAGELEIAAIADVNAEARSSASELLGLEPSRCFADMHEALAKVDAELCIVVIPPAHHREAILAACQRGLHVLTEKPIADTWEACLDIHRAVRAAGVKCQVVQNYRFAPHNLTLKQAIVEGRIGQLLYVMGRFAADYRTRGAWGMFRHEIPHGLLVEGAVHHLDQIRNLTGADCSMVAGWDWNPGHASFDGECCALLTLRMGNGVHAQYEGHCLAAGWRNDWYEEAYRAEGLEGSLVVDRDQTVRLLQHTSGRGLRTEELPTLQPEYPSHQAIIRQFLDWLDGGAEPPTSIEDNIKSAALLFGAVRASETNSVVDVRQLVSQAQA